MTWLAVFTQIRIHLHDFNGILLLIMFLYWSSQPMTKFSIVYCPWCTLLWLSSTGSIFSICIIIMDDFNSVHNVEFYRVHISRHSFISFNSTQRPKTIKIITCFNSKLVKYMLVFSCFQYFLPSLLIYRS